MYRWKSADWWHHYWRIRHHCDGYSVAPTPGNVRMASILLDVASRSGAEPSGEPGDPRRVAIEYLEEVVLYGRKAFYEELGRIKAQTRVGAQR